MKGYKNVGMRKLPSMKVKDKKKYVPPAKAISRKAWDFSGKSQIRTLKRGAEECRDKNGTYN